MARLHESLKEPRRSVAARGAAALLLAGLMTLTLTASCNDDDDDFAGRNGCGDNADCGGGLPYCVDGLCVQCIASTQCGGGDLCDPISGSCNPPCSAAATAECDGGHPVCDADNGVCVRCLDDGDCGQEAPFCARLLDRCAECRSDADCGGEQRFCDPSRGDCVVCRDDADCAPSEVCGPDFECRFRCDADTDCGGEEPYCNLENGDCVECLADGNCEPGQSCLLGQCAGG